MNDSAKNIKKIFELITENYKKKYFKTAEILCNKILKIDPNHFGSIFILANIYGLNKNFDKAKQLLHKAIEIKPNNAGALNNLGNVYKELGEVKEAIIFYKKAIQVNPNYTNAHYNLGLIFYKTKDLKQAKNCFEQTIKIKNNYSLAFFSLANVYIELKEFKNAVKYYQKAIEINQNFVSAYNNLGLAFQELNDFKNAIHCYEKVIKIKYNHINAHHNLGKVYKEMGKFNEAIKFHEMAIKYDKKNLMHYYYLSKLKNEILDSNFKKNIEKNISNDTLPQSNKIYGNYLLSIFERESKNYKQELNYLTKAHQFFFNSKKTTFKSELKYTFEEIFRIKKGLKLKKLKNNQDYKLKPIFIIGIARCGSTLIEKIIASGSKFIPMGEETSILENFINNKIIENKSLNLGDVEKVRNELYQIYKHKGLVSKSYDYIFTDKSLNNFFYLDLIKDIYPKAKIINCKRNILSIIVSIFQNNLSKLSWAHDLENIFTYCNNYFKIISNYKNKNSDFIYELQFEKLVNNPEKESKKLMKFCELPWNKKCLEFYKRKDLISKTASNIQIRKAIYKQPSQKYLPYKKLLTEYGKKYSWFD